MYQRLGNEFILNFIKENFNDFIEILNKNEQLYTQSRLKCKCKIDGYEWETTYDQLKLGHGCPVCKMVDNRINNKNTRAKKVNYNMFIRVLSQLSKDDIELVTKKKDFIYNTANALHFKCNKHNYDWNISGIGILKRTYCPLCEKERTIKRNGKEFIDKIHQVWPHIDFAEEYKGYETAINFVNKETNEIFKIQPQNLIRRIKENKKTPKGEQNPPPIKIYQTEYPLLELYPDLQKYVKDKEQIKNIRPTDQKKVILNCPYCGGEKEVNSIDINTTLKRGFKCHYCSKQGISYPNRFIFELLQHLNNIEYKNNPINFKREYSPIWANKLRFDIYFKLNDIDYYIELDGDQHFHSKFYRGKLKKDNITAEELLKEVQERDKLKDKLVKENDGIMIRINCANTDIMKDNILNSELNNILNLSNVKWEEISKKAEENIVLKIWELYNDGKGKTVKEIKDELNIAEVTIVRYLKRGRNIGVITETAEESHLKVLEYANVKNRKLIKVVKISTQEVFYYDSGATFAQYLINNDIDFYKKKRNVIGASINSACRHNKLFHGYEINYISEEEKENIKDKIITLNTL